MNALRRNRFIENELLYAIRKSKEIKLKINEFEAMVMDLEKSGLLEP
jgi:hypothetical protein